jgi:hypothetical protein
MFALECVILKIQENQEGLELIGTSELLICANVVNVLGKNINTIKRNTEAVVGRSNEVDVEL